MSQYYIIRMDTRTLQALSVACNFESTRELQQLREENKKLKQKLNNIDANFKMMKETLNAGEMIASTIQDRPDFYGEGADFKSIFNAICEEEEISYEDDEVERCIELEAKHRDKLRENPLENGMKIDEEIGSFYNYLEPFMRFSRETPEVFAYLMEKYNPIAIALNETSTSRLIGTSLTPNNKVHFTRYKFDTREDLDFYYEDNKDILDHNFREENGELPVLPEDLNQRREFLMEQEIENGLVMRCSIWLNKMKLWNEIKDRKNVEALRPIIMDGKDEIVIHDYIVYASNIIKTLRMEFGMTGREFFNTRTMFGNTGIYTEIKGYMEQHNLL